MGGRGANGDIATLFTLLACKWDLFWHDGHRGEIRKISRKQPLGSVECKAFLISMNNMIIVISLSPTPD
jgi:hypothetical protein